MKKQSFQMKQWAKVCLALSLGLPLTACVDDSYDASKDIDMTMGLGSQGLQLKLGNTENIMLADLLEEDENLKTDAQHTYYLIESGRTNVNFSVDRMNAYIDNAVLSPTLEVLNYSKLQELIPATAGSLNVPEGFVYQINNLTADNNMNFKFDNISSVVKQVKSITPAAGTKLKISMALEQNGMYFAIRDIDNLKIKLPKYLQVANPTNATIAGQVVSVNPRHNVNSTNIDLAEMDIAKIVLDGNDGKVNGGTLSIPNTEVSLSGDFKVSASRAFTPTTGSKLTLHVYLHMGNTLVGQNEVVFDNVTGRFDPDIAPTIESINIKDNLPDFLDSDDVTIQVANPTLKFMADLSNVPASIEFNAGLKANKKDGTVAASVNLPASGNATLLKEKKNHVYFYEDAAAGPYSPAAIEATAKKFQVDGISSLITKLPDNISVDLKENRRVKLVDEDVTIQLGRTYNSDMSYDLYVPFTFNNGLNIVYNDSVTGMNKDLKDYEADGLVVTANIFNAVPLDLTATVIPVDVNGRVINEIVVSEANVAPAQPKSVLANEAEVTATGVETPVQINMTLTDPKALKRLDVLRLRIQAAGTQTAGQKAVLSSLQYIKVKDIRLKLKGQIVADFN